MGLLDTAIQHDSRLKESVSEAVKEAQHEMDRMEGNEDKARMDEFEERLEGLEQEMSELEERGDDGQITREEFDDLKDDVNEIAHMMLQLVRERQSG